MLAARTLDPLAVTYGEVAVAGGSLPVAVAGTGDPVIFLHGWTLDHRMWAPQVEGLAGCHHLVMPDRRGCGRATAPPDLAREPDDVIAIADALGLDRFALVGLSQGAAIALEVARRFAPRITGLAVAGAPLPALVPREESLDLEAYRAWAAAGDIAAMRAEWSLHPLMQAHSPATHALLGAMLADYDGRDLLVPGEAPVPGREAIAALPMPVLALVGEHDTPWRRACARALAALAPRARAIEIPAAGHLANCDNPNQFNRIMRDFLMGSATSPQ